MIWEDCEIEILKNTVKIFYGLDEDGFNQLEYVVIQDMFQIISNILTIEQELVTIFIHNNVEYGINPNFNDITFGEMVDCDTTDIIQQICILYRPIVSKKGGKYIIEKYKANIEIYNELKETLTLDIYLGFIGFFLSIHKSLLNYTLNYITEKASDPDKKKLLEKSGNGLDGYTNYAMVPKVVR